MKTLELKLKKDVLIVEIPRLADYEFINKECKYLKVGNEEIKLNASTLDKFEFLCKGSELTEEIASELVDFWQKMGSYRLVYENYKTDLPKKKTALESFISAVESKGFYWLENPISNPNKIIQTSLSFKKFAKHSELFDIAEEKTFRNPLIFVKK